MPFNAHLMADDIFSVHRDPSRSSPPFSGESNYSQQCSCFPSLILRYPSSLTSKDRLSWKRKYSGRLNRSLRGALPSELRTQTCCGLNKCGAAKSSIAHPSRRRGHLVATHVAGILLGKYSVRPASQGHFQLSHTGREPGRLKDHAYR